MAKRVWYPHTELEEHRHGMWRRTSIHERDAFVAAAANLMRDVQAFQAILEWERSFQALMLFPEDA